MSWTVFFCGCKRISKMVYGHDETYEGDLATLLDWVFYHDVLYKFSIRHWTQRVEEQRQLAKETKIISKQIYSPLRSVVRVCLFHSSIFKAHTSVDSLFSWLFS
jgi:hypothetical protein